MIVGVGLGVRTDPGFRPKKLGPRKLGVMELDALASSLAFAIVQLSCAIISAGTMSFSGLLEAAESYKKFVYHMAILDQSEAK